MPETKILIPGPCGNIEIAYQEGRGSKAFVMCHPHPLFQGNMDNKVVTTTCKAFQELGLATVRFNYRGVGMSEGSYGEGIGEGEDLKAVADWIQQAWKPTELWLGGFSFGGYVAYRMANIIHAARLLTIGPAVVRLDFKPLPEPTMPWI
ncbi:MAG: alpha/beta hydrolase, partial [Gammaproteobacteria bacterium]|nr:alpha/beta hydrolase [Gammaproteobacteria bacterium]